MQRMTRRRFLLSAALVSTSVALASRLPAGSTAALAAPAQMNVPGVGASDAQRGQPPDAGQPSTRTQTMAPGSLRELADKAGLDLGSVFIGWAFNDSAWRDVMAREFNLGMMDWGFWPNEIHPQRDSFTYAIADRVIAAAQATGMKLRVDSLIFGNNDYRETKLPDWLKNGQFSREELIDVLVNHVSTIVGHYKGIVHEWVVVNEPFKEPYRAKDFFYTTLGYDYIDIAYEAARKADPSAILNYSDTENHTARGWSRELTQQTAARLRSKGLIDMVGLQMHIDASRPPQKDDMVATMVSYGMPVSVTSLDVDLQKVDASDPERLNLQADIYRTVFQAAMESGACKSFGVWGIGDKYSWLEQYLNRPNADPTMFDDDMNPKPAYFAIRDELQKLVVT